MLVGFPQSFLKKLWLNMKTPLRYPGGKSRAVKTLMEFLPQDCGDVCSPFLGGGSFELALAEKGIKVYGYDIFKPLVWFWKALLQDPNKLADYADVYRTGPHDFEYKKQIVSAMALTKEDFIRLRSELRLSLEKNEDFSFENAAKFYAINRSSFSGATFSGGFSKRASYARFTDSSIDRIRNFKEFNLIVEHAPFWKSIPKHSDKFLYLDPPYMLGKNKDKLYGNKGDTHQDFDHQLLCDLLKKRNNWLLSYNDCEVIRELYKDFEIVEANWAYGMKLTKDINPETKKRKMAKSSEVLIMG